MNGFRRFAARVMARLFVERQVILRSRDRVRSVRMTPRAQKAAVLLAALALGWGLFSSISYVGNGRVIERQQAALDESRLAYFELLSEVSEYHQEFEKIILDLESNQTLLLSLLGDDIDDASRRDEIENRLARSADERARVVVASDGLRGKLEAFENDLLALASRNNSLRNEVQTMRDALQSTEAQREQVTAARARLGRRLDETIADLEASEAARERMAGEIGALKTTLASVRGQYQASLGANDMLTVERSQLEDRVGFLEDERDGLKAQMADLQVALAEVRGNFARVSEKRRQTQAALSDLERRASELDADRTVLAMRNEALRKDLETSWDRQRDLVQREEALTAELKTIRAAYTTALETKTALAAALAESEDGRGRAVRQAADLDAERRRLVGQVNGLQTQLAEFDRMQSDLLAHMADRAESGMNAIEQAVEMTGLKVDDLLGHDSSVTANQGGPFIPYTLDVLAQTPPVSEDLKASTDLLRLRMDRWQALQGLLGSMPLAPPLDQYSISSRYGKRKDPINGRAAAHYGLDFAAPFRSPVYAPAPGKVVFAGWRGRYGRMIEIDHGYGIKTRYAHLKSIDVKKGESVSNRHKIGTLGSSGRSTGPHVHYEVRVNGKPYDPMNFLQAGKHVFK